MKMKINTSMLMGMSNKKKKIIFSTMGVIIVAVLLIGLFRQAAQSRVDTNALNIDIVRKRDIVSAVQATGIIKAKIGAEVKVGSRISGRVERLYANVGDKVKKGQVIARLEQLDLEAKVSEAKMNLSVADANMELAEKNHRRMQNLYAKDLVSRDKVDIAERDLKVALAQVDQLRAVLKFNETQQSYATIISPISGVIASVTTQEGETVSATSLSVPTFVNIVDLRRLEIYAYVDENDIGKIKPGLEASVIAGSNSELAISGKVVAIYPKATIQDNVVYYITTISFDNPDGKLKPDLTVNATIFLEKRGGVLAVPNKAIRRESNGKAVHVTEDGVIRTKLVKTGLKDAHYTEVVEGLKEGERIVVGDAVKAANK